MNRPVSGDGDSADVLRERIAELEAAIREMILSIPGGQSCDPQRVADRLRVIAKQNGVTVE